MNKRILLTLSYLLLSLFSLPALSAEEKIMSLDDLLKKVESGRYQEAAEHAEREKRFMANKAAQAELLAQVKQELAEQEALSIRLEKEFDENESTISGAEIRLRESLGSLSEIFGHITSASGDAKSNIENSLVNIGFPGREQFFDELIAITSSGTQLPTIGQIDRLAFEMQREMTEQGRIVKFPVQVTSLDGQAVQTNVVRIGVFNVVAEDGRYLQLENGHLVELPRQPGNVYLDAAEELAKAREGIVQVGIDPTGPSGGGLLAALINTPSLSEQWHQGGTVGYIITLLGLLALSISIWRMLVLINAGKKVDKQLTSHSGNADNPLGRVLIAAEKYKGSDLETLELKMNEAMLKELPSLQAGEALLKIIAAVAPLLGLLGTVTGMIVTFQSITIYGAGDPKAMSGGISAALVTTVLGLIVAIPAVLAHTLISTRSKRIIHILEEQATGIVAQYQESK